MNNNRPLNWFEIPALDLSRASLFYERILGVSLKVEGPLAVFPYDRAGGATGGCVMQAPGYRPSAEGTVVYLHAGTSLDAVLERVSAAGGSIALPKTALPPGMGSFAHIVDTEGNRVGLHSPSV
jgi:uncharacterized protein